MASERWTTVVFQDLIDARQLEIGDGYRAKNDELGGNGPLFLRAGHVTDTHITFNGVERFRAELTDRVRPKMASHGDTIVTTKGNSTGRTSYVTSKMPPFVYSPHLSYWRSLDHSQLVPGFLRYWSQGMEFAKQLQGMKASTDMAPYLSLTDQRRLRITLPPARYQKAIAHILGTLDDKIELNRRMNETLEAMARAIFKSWFVDFDPVRAKATGRPTGLPNPIANLFPDSFEDSELGKIPKGWKVKTLGELLELAYGKALKAENRREGGIPVYGSNGLVGWHDERLVSGPGIVVGRKGNPGIVTWAPTDFFPIDTTFYVIPRERCPSLHFLFHVLRKHDLASLGADSAVPGLNRNLAYMSQQVLPPTSLLEAFDAKVGALADCVHRNTEQSRTLAAIRDALLPKLLSGELSPSECRP